MVNFFCNFIFIRNVFKFVFINNNGIKRQVFSFFVLFLYSQYLTNNNNIILILKIIKLLIFFFRSILNLSLKFIYINMLFLKQEEINTL